MGVGSDWNGNGNQMERNANELNICCLFAGFDGLGE